MTPPPSTADPAGATVILGGHGQETHQLGQPDDHGQETHQLGQPDDHDQETHQLGQPDDHDQETHQLGQPDTQTAYFDIDSGLNAITVRIEGASQLISLPNKDEIILGRGDPHRQDAPDLDLTDYGAQKLGVSRRHLSIRRTPGGVSITDLGSANGTLLNGDRISAHRPHTVRDGDKIQLSKLVLNIYI